MYSWASKVSEKYVCSRCGEAAEFGSAHVCLENTQISKIHSNVHDVYSSEEHKVSQEASDRPRADVNIARQKIEIPFLSGGTANIYGCDSCSHQCDPVQVQQL